RLPRIAIPLHYALTVTPDIAAERFSGEVAIDVTIQRPISAIELNAAEIAFRNVTVTAGGKTQTATVTTDETAERATLTVAEPLPIGPATIHIAYDGSLNRQLRGFYIGVVNGRKYLASQMESTDARRAFPSFDEPDMKATFQITVVADANDAVISNSPIESDTPGPASGKHTVRFAITPRLSTYHIALVVGDFDCLRGSFEGIPLGICAPSDRVASGQLSMKATKELMRFFHGYYTAPYPFQKLDQIALTDFSAGAMENPGAITYRERILLANEKTSTDETRRRSVSTIAHEIAHMWFGDLVTMRWWDDIWLNEGFATWMARKAIASTFPSTVPATYVARSNDEPLATDVLATTRAIHKSAETPDEIEQLFDSVAYSKTAALLQMIEAYVGEAKFRDGINLYLERNAWGNASGSDFAAALNDATGRDVADVLASYVSQPGVPIVQVKSRCEAGQTVVDLQQERFLIRGGESVRSQFWTIPVCVGGGDCLLLRERRQTFRLPGCRKNLVANREGRGYYLTAYEDGDPRQGLSPSEELVLVRDSWYLVRAGRRDIGEHFNLATSLAGPAETFSTILENAAIAERHLVDGAERAALQSWLRQQAQPVARRLGWRPAATESPEERQLRTTILGILADAGGDVQVRKQAREVTSKLLSDPSSVDPGLALKAIEIAAIAGDKKLYESYLRTYRTAADATLRSQALSGLSKFRDATLLRRTLQLTLTDDIRSQDLAEVLGGVIGNRAGTAIGWQFLNENWAAIARKLPPGHAGRIVGVLGWAACDPKWRDEVLRFAKEHDLKNARQATAQAAERIENCIELRALQQANLDEWLRTRSR
ncbi:MAG: M1 family metallopeptidase, partial [Thermoanaerobaculia bacterium]